MGYAVTNASEGDGFIAAEKQTSGLGRALLTGTTCGSGLTVSVIDGGEGRLNLRVTAGQTAANPELFRGAKTASNPSPNSIADAKALLSAYGQGKIKSEPCNAKCSAQFQRELQG